MTAAPSILDNPPGYAYQALERASTEPSGTCQRKGCPGKRHGKQMAFCSSRCRAYVHDHPEADLRRATSRIAACLGIMADGQWRTVVQLARAVGCKESTAGAALRNLRQKRYGGMVVDRRNAGGRNFEFRVVLS